MKRLLLALVLACLGLTGCMDLKVKMIIAQDWSGTAVMRLEMLDQMFEMIKMQLKQSGEDMSFFDEESLRAKIEEDGGELKKYSSTSEVGIRTMELEISFKNARAMMDNAGGGQFTLKQEGDEWVWGIMDNEMGLAFQNMNQEELEQQITMMTSMMTGMKWDFSFQVPGMVKTNMNKVDDKTVGFVLSYDDDIAGKTGKEAVEAFRKMMEPKWVRFKDMK